jgi:hypothetical protein
VPAAAICSSLGNVVDFARVRGQGMMNMMMMMSMMGGMGGMGRS